MCLRFLCVCVFNIDVRYMCMCRICLSMALVCLNIYFLQRKFLSLFENQLLVRAVFVGKKYRLLFISNNKKKIERKKSSAWISKSEPYNNKSNFLSFLYTQNMGKILYSHKNVYKSISSTIDMVEYRSTHL